MKSIASGMELKGITAIGFEVLRLAGTRASSQENAKDYQDLHAIITRALRHTFPDYDLQALMGVVRDSPKKPVRREVGNIQASGIGEKG